MQKEKFQRYLHNTDSYKNANLFELGELIREFPWFSSAAIILLQSSNIQEDNDIICLLKKYSIIIPNRKVLSNLLGSLPAMQINESVPEEKLSPDPHSRIPGIFDSLENNYDTEDIQTETKSNSVLDDESLLDFSYYSQEKSESGISAGNEGGTNKSEENLTQGDNQKNFDHWISKMTGESEIEKTPIKKHEIIESFIHSDPGVIRADKETGLHGDISQGSAEENEGFITDTLAKIYLKQGLYNKAIFAYEKLCLKYPEKSIYFVSQIEEIKSLYIKK